MPTRARHLQMDRPHMWAACDIDVTIGTGKAR